MHRPPLPLRPGTIPLYHHTRLPVPPTKTAPSTSLSAYTGTTRVKDIGVVHPHRCFPVPHGCRRRRERAGRQNRDHRLGLSPAAWLEGARLRPDFRRISWLSRTSSRPSSSPPRSTTISQSQRPHLPGAPRAFTPSHGAAIDTRAMRSVSIGTPIGGHASARPGHIHESAHKAYGVFHRAGMGA